MWFNLKVRLTDSLAFNKEAESDAAKNLYVISETEANRRLFNAFLFFALFGSGAYLIERHGLSRLWRLLLTPLLTVAVYHVFSWQDRVCGIARYGYWDPDGCGMRRVEDPSLKERLRGALRAVWLKTAAASIAIFLGYWLLV